MNDYKKFSVGELVTVKKEEDAYDNYGKIYPGDIGIIQSFPPKVCIVKGDVYDSLPYFAYVVFNKVRTSGAHTHNYRGGINIRNLKKVSIRGGIDEQEKSTKNV